MASTCNGRRSNAKRQADYRRRCKLAMEEQLRAKGLPDLPAISILQTDKYKS